MLNRTRIGSFILAAALPAAAAAQAGTRTTQRAEQAIRAADSVMQSAVAAHDADKATALYAPDAVFMTPHAPASVGAAAIRKSWSDLFAMPGTVLTWAPTRVDVAASGDLATESGNYKLSYDSPNGKVNDAGGFVTVWRKSGGDWKVVSEAATSSMPMSAMVSTASAGGAVSGMADAANMEEREASALTWTEMAVPGFAPGMKMAVVHGDPAGAGTYVLRLQFPDGYEFPLHWHPVAEQLTVLSGSFHLAMEDSAGQGAPKTYAPGDYLYIPARMAHAGGAKGVTIIQLHGTGPFAITVGSAKGEK
jgi:uncharacterized protein (TIGR02246 family)